MAAYLESPKAHFVRRGQIPLLDARAYDDQVFQDGTVVRNTCGGCGICSQCGGPDAGPNSNPAAGCGGSGPPIFLDAAAWPQRRRQCLDPVGSVSICRFRQDRGRRVLHEKRLRPPNPVKRGRARPPESNLLRPIGGSAIDSSQPRMKTLANPIAKSRLTSKLNVRNVGSGRTSRCQG
jgi:hypothetical protein